MATADDLRRIALSLAGTGEAPHVDRRAFKAVRTYVTLAADGATANFKFAPDEQEFKCMTAPDAFAAIPGGWGRMGWTVAWLDRLGLAELTAALEMAYAHGATKKTRKKRS